MMLNYYYFLTLKLLRLINNNKWRKFFLVFLNDHNKFKFLVNDIDLFSFYYLLKNYHSRILKKNYNFFLFHLNYQLYYKCYFLIYNYFILAFSIYIFSLYEYFHLIFLLLEKEKYLFILNLVVYKYIKINNIELFLFFLLRCKYFFSHNRLSPIKAQFFLFPYINLTRFDNNLNLFFLYSLKILRKNLFFICKKSYGHSTSWFIRQTNYILLKWFHKWKDIILLNKIKKYHKNDLLFSLDNWIFNKQFRYINRNHSKSSLLWKVKNYFGPFNPYQKDFWVFGDKFSSIYAIKILWVNNY
ncbi:reverse transcriptase (plastid) [Lotharella oceanica]|uniref:Reverse transcriptase n=1 Tax=Lotharella oceanica TaxID=641309 RepID=A0A059SLD0_9EUKA|nr:reverse transcriptase [Lotharella oceanica]